MAFAPGLRAGVTRVLLFIPYGRDGSSLQLFTPYHSTEVILRRGDAAVPVEHPITAPRLLPENQTARRCHQLKTQASESGVVSIKDTDLPVATACFGKLYKQRLPLSRGFRRFSG